MIAEYHHVIFNELLLSILVEKYMSFYKLKIKQDGFTVYNSDINPSGIHEVGVAALRFYHATVQLFQRNIHDHLLSKLYEHDDVSDILHRDINRGRETGVPGYVYYVEYCTGIPVNSWTDLNQIIAEEYVKRLAKVYKYYNCLYYFEIKFTLLQGVYRTSIFLWADS